MEQRVRELLGEYQVPVEVVDPSDLATQLAIRLAEVERAVEAAAREVQRATELAVASAKQGDLRAMTRGSLIAAVTDKAAAFDAALMRVAERREALALVAHDVRQKRGTASN